MRPGPLVGGSRGLGRRAFLRGGIGALAAWAAGGGSAGCGGGGGGGAAPPPAAPVSNLANLGPLGAPDARGLRLPAGFTSRVVARSRQAPTGASAALWHDAPDGGACFPAPGGGWRYVSNAEVGGGGGGVRVLVFDPAGSVVDCYPILAGTSRNCAGGRTPWGTWLSCEEEGEVGEVHECDPAGAAAALRWSGLGRCRHEAAAWEAVQGRLYMTEDRPDGALLRFTPAAELAPGRPDFGVGVLEVATVAGGGPEGAVSWSLVPDPSAAVTPLRYQVAGMTPFAGGEGMVARNGIVYFATKGDNRIWSLDVVTGQLTILFDDDTLPADVLDNLAITPDGDVLVAEDGGDMQILALTPGGAVVPVLQLVGHPGSELTGPAFDPSRRRLYFSSQRGPSGTDGDGMTFEVTGPFVV